ncbi:hypothetical protein BDW69DRAFT_170333 [Aspergillus filifer]
MRTILSSSHSIVGLCNNPPDLFDSTQHNLHHDSSLNHGCHRQAGRLAHQEPRRQEIAPGDSRRHSECAIPSAQRLVQLSPNIKLVEGTVDEPATIFQNAQKATKAPIWGVFGVQTPSIGKEGAEETQGKALIDETLKHEVEFFVQTSVDRGGEEKSPNSPTDIPHFAAKHNIEQHLMTNSKGTDMRWFILRPVAFMENLTAGFFGKVFATSYKMALRGKPLQHIATSDIGYFAAEGLLNPDVWAGRGLSLAGDELTYD